MNKIYTLPLLSLVSAVFLSGCSTSSGSLDNNESVKSVKTCSKNDLKKYKPGLAMLRESCEDDFSKVYFTLKMFNKNVVANAINMIHDRVSLDHRAYSELYENYKDEHRKINGESIFAINLLNSSVKYIKDNFANENTNVKRDKKLVLLDFEIKNYQEKPFELTPEFVRERFKNQVAFWFNEKETTILTGQSARLVVAVGGTENFKVKKKIGTTGLNFNTKREITTPESRDYYFIKKP